MPYTKDEHQQVAAKMQRDSEGHFIHTKSPNVNSPTSNSTLNQLSSIIKPSNDDLIDIHVGNPLRKIVTLLQEIKQQKAFSFTLKGSLGIAGVALALGVFGVFGGGQILCDRGVQSQIGVIKVLNAPESLNDSLITKILSIANGSGQSHNRVVLIKNDETVIGLTGKSLISNPSSLITNGYPVIATGSYNSCSQTLTIADDKGIQIYAK